MKLVLQIVAGILIAGAISSVAWYVWTRIELEAAARQMNDELRKVQIQAAADLARSRQQADQAAKQRLLQEKARADAKAWQDQQREQVLRLKPGEECLGGFQGRPGTIIVRSVANGVAQSVQLLEYGRPVECVGDHRLDNTASQFPKR